jgi:hypothetical protein
MEDLSLEAEATTNEDTAGWKKYSTHSSDLESVEIINSFIVI